MNNASSNITKLMNNEIPSNLLSKIEYLIFDTRKIVYPETSLFFAITGERKDGHDFIPDAYQKGIRYFVTSQNFEVNEALFPDAFFLQVKAVRVTLQLLVALHRATFTYPVIGITGSNGKTIVKEWLYQLLNTDYQIVRSPRSYNSQIGVPISVWQMKAHHTLGIFEAGISKSREMTALAGVIQPTIGILTSIGDAHKEGFVDYKQKILEKLQLFSNCKQLIYCMEDIDQYLDLPTNRHTLFQQNIQLFSWSREKEATLKIIAEVVQQNTTQVSYAYENEVYIVNIPFVDTASVNNAITCICTLLILKIPFEKIQERLLQLQPIEMRMQLNKGIKNCYVINDSYSNDLSSLSIALDYLQMQAGNKKTTIILSDILQSGLTSEVLYSLVAMELEQRNIQRLIGIGETISKMQFVFDKYVPIQEFYESTEQFLEQNFNRHYDAIPFQDEYILIKGARAFEFEHINAYLEQKVHKTVLEINLSAVVQNLKQYQQKLLPTTKLMAMVKAFSYGSGSIEIARLLQFHQIDYLAVAYTDEGVDLRLGDIKVPIMVMNVDEAGFDALVEYNLEPEIYSFSIYHAFHEYLLKQGIVKYPVHIKLNTGMNRLGFEPTEMEAIGKLLAFNNTMQVQSVFSHLVGSESPALDGFTQQQDGLFSQATTVLSQALAYPFLKHIANSSGIFRHSHLQYDMVRLGIGLYGVDSAQEQNLLLQTVATLKTTIAQIRTVKATETVGYNRNGKLNRDSKIATIRIGYADGYNRKLGNGVGKVIIHGKKAPTIGNICMDMAMIDVTDIPNVKEGDSVELFGNQLPIQQVAKWIDTIAYEVMAGISQRVKRVYLEE